MRTARLPGGGGGGWNLIRELTARAAQSPFLSARLAERAELMA